MGIVRTGESEMDKELKKWDTPKRLGGYGPDGYEQFPQMLYKALRTDTGRVQVGELPPHVAHYREMSDFHRAESLAKAFTDKCQLTVRNQQEYDRAFAEGWRDTAAQALAHHEALEREMAQAAAEANFAVQRMTEKARTEFQAASDATDAQIADVPAPYKRPKAKADPAHA